MEAVISESLFKKQKSSFDILNRNWVFILLFNNNNNNNNNINEVVELTTHKKRYIYPDKRQQIIDELRLVPKKDEYF